MGAWALRRVPLAIALLGLPIAHVRAQASGPSAQAPARPRAGVPATVRYGKWLALGSAFALGFRANALHQDANDSYQALRDRCFEVPSSCTLGPNGRYSDPVSERLFLATEENDRRASRYLIGAEVSFALAAAGFIWELIERQDGTPNIPFEPRVESGRESTRVGVAIRF